MVNKNMDETDSQHTSTPLQCRHDSGYGSYPNHYGLLELSPIRKQPSDMQQEGNKVKHLVNSDRVNPKKLIFLNVSNENNNDNSENDSGIASSINESSAFESDNLSSKKAQYVKDENSNFTCLTDDASGDKLYQPAKYACKDHLHEKYVTSGLCNTYKIFKRHAISFDRFKSEKENSKVDFFHELDIRNCTGIISNILSYLSDEDLRHANNVSKEWQDIVSNDKTANQRRVLYINNKKNAARGPNKENKVKIATSVERYHKTAFTSLTNVENDAKQPLVFEIFQGRFDSFIQELNVEENQQSLMKCPKCRYPARTDGEFKYCCTRKLCKHEFCKKCLGPFLDNHKCSLPGLKVPLSSIVIGSKKSRKNLRRLK